MAKGSKATKLLEEAHRDTVDISLSDGDDVDKFDGIMSDNLSSHGSTAMETTETIQLAAAETRLVWWSKLLMLFVLGMAAMACVVATFLVTQASELNEFKNEVENHANEIIDLSKISASNTFLTIEGLSVTITSYALDQKIQWPFLVVPHFDFRTKRIRRLVGGNPVTISPFVSSEQREEWELFTANNQDWVPDEYDTRPEGSTDPLYPTFIHGYPVTVPPETLPTQPDRIYLPNWQRSPVHLDEVNLDAFTEPDVADVIDELHRSRKLVLSTVQAENADPADPASWPTSTIIAPVFSELNRMGDVAASINIPVPWHTFFENILPEAKDSMVVVVQDSCGSPHTFRVDGPEVFYVGVGDLHDRGLDKYMHSAPFNVHDKGADNVTLAESHCFFTLEIYPSRSFFKASKTSNPILYSAVVFAIFLVTSLVFLLYDCFVQKRQKIVMTSAQRSNAIVSSLFPEQVRERLMEDAQNNAAIASGSTPFGLATRPITGGNESLLSSKPIADLFPHATVLFADICDFTAWASVREPAQVFTLLEQIYSAFDVIAKRRRIFKVETIGDCYVAVAGLPEPRKDHAVVMARFAHACRVKLVEVVKDLEVLLGPDTADLGMRFGLHSGPVTAGVLRGEKSRFQLFGDTVNTAARIESSGLRNMIHISSDTASLLQAAGKGEWVHLRDGLVSAKGKGMIQTYWLAVKAGTNFNGSAIAPEEITTVKEVNKEESKEENKEDKDKCLEVVLAPSSSKTKRIERLIEWNVDVLIRLLKRIIAMRDDGKADKKNGRWGRSSKKTASAEPVDISRLKIDPEEGKTVLDEVREIIELSNETKSYKQDPETIELDEAVVDQIRDFVTKIAHMYHDNSFHSFEHASHVTQSVTKLLSRIVTADDIDYTNLQYKKTQGANELHDFTFGITSDPIIQFSCAFSAMIHDVDHQGVGNATLVAEGTELAKMYKNKSVAEQNSVDLAWSLLMQPQFADFRACIYNDQPELERFRQLVVNSVMATDIVDKELGAARKARWAKAFDLESKEPTGLPQENTDSEIDAVNRKATIVIEHIIQASDVSHTMQHWHVYIKWNEKLFHELYKAHLDGRGTFDPSKGWYTGELGFYDFYIIPLAKKLADCGVFGVSSDEYLNYALANRAEWEQKGEKVLEGYMARYRDANGNLPEPKPKVL